MRPVQLLGDSSDSFVISVVGRRAPPMRQEHVELVRRRLWQLSKWELARAIGANADAQAARRPVQDAPLAILQTAPRIALARRQSAEGGPRYHRRRSTRERLLAPGRL